MLPLPRGRLEGVVLPGRRGGARGRGDDDAELGADVPRAGAGAPALPRRPSRRAPGRAGAAADARRARRARPALPRRAGRGLPQRGPLAGVRARRPRCSSDEVPRALSADPARAARARARRGSFPAEGFGLGAAARDGHALPARCPGCSSRGRCGRPGSPPGCRSRSRCSPARSASSSCCTRRSRSRSRSSPGRRSSRCRSPSGAGRRRCPSGSLVVLGLGAAFGVALWQVAAPLEGDALFHLARVAQAVGVRRALARGRGRVPRRRAPSRLRVPALARRSSRSSRSSPASTRRSSRCTRRACSRRSRSRSSTRRASRSSARARSRSRSCSRRPR